MPGFVANPVAVGVCVADIHIAQGDQALEFLCIGEVDGKVGFTEPQLAHIKIPDTMIRISGWSKRAGCLGQVAVGLACFGQEEAHLFDDIAYAGCQQQVISDITAYLLIAI